MIIYETNVCPVIRCVTLVTPIHQSATIFESAPSPKSQGHTDSPIDYYFWSHQKVHNQPWEPDNKLSVGNGYKRRHPDQYVSRYKIIYKKNYILFFIY